MDFSTWFLNSLGIVFQMAGIGVGAYSIKEVILGKVNWIPPLDPYNTLGSSDLPRDPKTNRVITPLKINRPAIMVSGILLIAGLAIQWSLLGPPP